MTPVAAFDPGRLGVDGDPYAELAALRAAGPVVRSDGGAWCVTGYDAVMEALRHPLAASGPIAQFYVAALPPGAARDEMSNRINFLDPPDHPRVRGIVNKAFTPRRIGDLRPFAERTAASLLDAVSGRDDFDVVGEFAHQLPSLVISEMLGVPPADRGQLTAWSDDVAALLAVSVSGDEMVAALAAAEEFSGYLADLIEDRKARPADDLLTALIEAEEDGQRLRRVELISLAATLYSAGHRTTRDLFGNGVSVLARRPDVVDAIADGSLPLRAVVTEFLRFEPPTLFIGRVASGPLELAGQAIAAGEPLLLYLAAANRDPEAFDHADAFRPARYLDASTPAPLSFAFGAHYCLGASLAKMEAEVMLGSLLDRFGTVEAATDDLEWRQRGPFRSLRELRITTRHLSLIHI